MSFDLFILTCGIAAGWCLRGAWHYFLTHWPSGEQRLTEDVVKYPRLHRPDWD